MPSHNPECTHGAAHSYSACRDRQNRPLEMLEDVSDPISAQEAPQEPQTADQLTDADREALSRALAGLAPQDPS